MLDRWANLLVDEFDVDRQGQYRIGQIDIQRLADGVIPYVNDLLTLAVHTASLYMGTDDCQGIEERIKETDSFNRFLKGHLETILNQLDGSRPPLEESMQIVASAVEGVFQNCGLSFKTVPEGLYIAVGAPSR